MIQDQAKQLKPYIDALAEGKKVKRKKGDFFVQDWSDLFIMGADGEIGELAELSIVKYRPFQSPEEVLPLLGKHVMGKDNKSPAQIVGVRCCPFDILLSRSGEVWVSPAYLFEYYCCQDGSPCGVVQ